MSVFDRVSKVINTPYARKKYMKIKLDNLIEDEHREVLNTNLGDFLKEADDIGYN